MLATDTISAFADVDVYAAMKSLVRGVFLH